MYQLLHVDIGDVVALIFPALPPCFSSSCMYHHVKYTQSLFQGLVHIEASSIPPSIRKRANASFNDPFLNSSAPLCRWAWSGPVMMNSFGVPQ